MLGFFKPPVKLIKALKRWVKEKFGEVFQCDYDGMEHGVQKDGFSCGILTRNTSERELYPDTPLWILRLAVLARVTLFLKYANNRIKEPEVCTHTLRRRLRSSHPASRNRI